MTTADCLFCGIAAKTVPAQLVHEDAECAAFHDIRPQAPVHVIVIPRRHVARVSELTEADATLAGRLVVTANQLARQFQVDESGYRL